jgi:hypothetical protein
MGVLNVTMMLVFTATFAAGRAHNRHRLFQSTKKKGVGNWKSTQACHLKIPVRDLQLDTKSDF